MYGSFISTPMLIDSPTNALERSSQISSFLYLLLFLYLRRFTEKYMESMWRGSKANLETASSILTLNPRSLSSLGGTRKKLANFSSGFRLFQLSVDMPHEKLDLSLSISIRSFTDPVQFFVMQFFRCTYLFLLEMYSISFLLSYSLWEFTVDIVCTVRYESFAILNQEKDVHLVAFSIIALNRLIRV